MTANLLFDLGGVLMNIDRLNCVRAFKRLGMTDPSQFLGEYSQKGPFRAIEEGAITVEEFRNIIRTYLPHPVSDREIDDAFCDFLLGIPDYRLEQLSKLHEHYGIYMLSNTNKLMWDSAIAKAFEIEGHDINYYFNGIVTSFEAHCMKPSPEIFKYTIAKLGIDPATTLFLDDSQANCEAAKALGFQTLHVAPAGAEFYGLLEIERPDIIAPLSHK